MSKQILLWVATWLCLCPYRLILYKLPANIFAYKEDQWAFFILLTFTTEKSSNYYRKFRFILKLDPKMSISFNYNQYIQMIEPSIKHFMWYWTMNEQVRTIDMWSKSMCPARYVIEPQKCPIFHHYCLPTCLLALEPPWNL